MSQKSIKITIGGRVYPLTITEKEEKSVLLSAKKIEDNIQKLQNQYNIKDPQDLLAMTTLEFATQLQNKSNISSNDNNELDNKLDSIIIQLQKIN